jgi:glutamyl-tRNA reductase
LKTIDDLKEVIAENLKNRQVEAEKAKVIISEEMKRFEVDLSKLCAAPLISEICRKFERIRQKELTRAIRKLGENDERKIAILERFSRELVERVAQDPIAQLKIAALNGNSELLPAAERLFQTKNGPEK